MNHEDMDHAERPFRYAWNVNTGSNELQQKEQSLIVSFNFIVQHHTEQL